MITKYTIATKHSEPLRHSVFTDLKQPLLGLSTGEPVPVWLHLYALAQDPWCLLDPVPHNLTISREARWQGEQDTHMSTYAQDQVVRLSSSLTPMFVSSPHVFPLTSCCLF